MEKIKIACMGDSLTWGDHATNPQFCSYPAVLRRISGDKYEIGNFSKCGAFAYLLPGDTHSFYYLDIMKKALDFAPDAALIMLGTNDANPYRRVDDGERIAAYTDGMTKIVTSLLLLPKKPEIFICTSPWIKDRASGFVENLDKIVSVQREFAKKSGLNIIDTRNFTIGKNEFYAEGLHFCDYGYKSLAGFIFQKLKEYGF